jgi:hypothetical protein
VSGAFTAAAEQRAAEMRALDRSLSAAAERARERDRALRRNGITSEPDGVDYAAPTASQARKALTFLAARGEWPNQRKPVMTASGPLARQVEDMARYTGLSGEDHYALLAYHALRLADRLQQQVVDFVYSDTRQPLMVFEPTPVDAVAVERERCAAICDARARGWDMARSERDDTYAMMQTAAKNEARALAVAIRAEPGSLDGHPCRSPYCECTPGQCAEGRRDARGEPL